MCYQVSCVAEQPHWRDARHAHILLGMGVARQLQLVHWCLDEGGSQHHCLLHLVGEQTFLSVELHFFSCRVAWL